MRLEEAFQSLADTLPEGGVQTKAGPIVLLPRRESQSMLCVRLELSELRPLHS